jgi:threonine dehydratase
VEIPVLHDVAAARRRIGGYVHRTPLASSSSLGERLGTRVSLKLELFQKTGSFKPRGAFNQLLGLPPGLRSRGVVGVSGGNFAQGLAYAGLQLGVPTRIVMPAGTPPHYVAATAGYGAEIEFAPTMGEMFTRADELRASGLGFLHPFDDPRMMAGNGTVGLEVLEDAPDATDVLVSIGGGGLMTGVAVAIKEQRPDVRIWGVETEGAHAMTLALEAGRPVEMAPTSIAKTLGAPWVSESTLAAAQHYLEDVIVVDDADAFRAIGTLMERAKVVAEPAASCTVTAAERLAGRLGPHVVLILCGGNLALSDLAAWRDRFGD